MLGIPKILRLIIAIILLASMSYFWLLGLLEGMPKTINSGLLNSYEQMNCAQAIEHSQASENATQIRYSAIRPEKMFERARSLWEGREYVKALHIYRCLASLIGVFETYRDVAQMRIGFAYFSGLGVPRDDQRASDLLCASHLQIYASANLFCGRTLALKGSPMFDLNRARQKFVLAASQGSELARQELAKIPQ
jgi:TPR repeat protein